MRSLWLLLGRAGYVLMRPLLGLLFRGTLRTRLLLVSEEKILLVQNWLGDASWGLPGGGLHKNETVIDGVVREAREETGLELSPDQLQSVGKFSLAEHGFRFDYELYVGRLPEPLPVKSKQMEIASVRWIPRKQLTGLKLSSEVTRALASWPESA